MFLAHLFACVFILSYSSLLISMSCRSQSTFSKPPFLPLFLPSLLCFILVSFFSSYPSPSRAYLFCHYTYRRQWRREFLFGVLPIPLLGFFLVSWPILRRSMYVFPSCPFAILAHLPSLYLSLIFPFSSSYFNLPAGADGHSSVFSEIAPLPPFLTCPRPCCGHTDTFNSSHLVSLCSPILLSPWFLRSS